ncbi:hypothetical protein B0H14DRAFT_2616643 [Mycena olivaceomarginata]|nr:hypothetical protein B0H14DRAFT_2616643 [Mycena olivaceomarginata]
MIIPRSDNHPLLLNPVPFRCRVFLILGLGVSSGRQSDPGILPWTTWIFLPDQTRCRAQLDFNGTPASYSQLLLRGKLVYLVFIPSNLGLVHRLTAAFTHRQIGRTRRTAAKLEFILHLDAVWESLNWRQRLSDPFGRSVTLQSFNRAADDRQFGRISPRAGNESQRQKIRDRCTRSIPLRIRSHRYYVLLRSVWCSFDAASFWGGGVFRLNTMKAQGNPRGREILRFILPAMTYAPYRYLPSASLPETIERIEITRPMLPGTHYIRTTEDRACGIRQARFNPNPIEDSSINLTA